MSATTVVLGAFAEVDATKICEQLLGKANQVIEICVDGERDLRFKRGSPLVFGTPSYWALQCHLREWNIEAPSCAVGANLIEETVSCLLGGYGIPAEVGLSAFHKIRSEGLTRPNPILSATTVFGVLSKPLLVSGRNVRYRFARQKSEYVAEAVRQLSDDDSIPTDSIGLRERLLQIPGVGLKTASWIVRNLLKATDVAIIDIHIQRAGIKAGFFQPDWTPSKDYLKMERAFLEFADVFEVPAPSLDTIMWNQMRVRNMVMS